MQKKPQKADRDSQVISTIYLDEPKLNFQVLVAVYLCMTQICSPYVSTALVLDSHYHRTNEKIVIFLKFISE